MPLEIKEIVVTASIVNTPPSSGSANNGTAVTGIQKEDLIAECVEQVLEILREKNER